MSRQSLKMKYHPAKKEVLFTRLLENGREYAILPSSKLGKYMNMKGTFVLQNFGNAFFDDIAEAFDGLDTLQIKVITTKLDYEDFLQMIELYNLNGHCKLHPTLIAELPNMDETFEQVKRHGENSIGILKAKSRDFYDIDLDTPSVKEAADSFAHQVDSEIREIREKLDNLGDSNVSLCFTGVYSSGKSAIINAILGFKILPENITSETAKMFEIRSPLNGDPVRIHFDIPGGHCELEWNSKEERFEFSKGPSENVLRTEIQGLLNKTQKSPQHNQIFDVLTKLNGITEVSSEIRIDFPISLDTEKVQFTIYDTPGTDSNYIEHKAVLADALAEQQQSILIFVAKPNGLEGEGNNALLSYLKEAERKNSKTSIDIGRSLFVINWADSVPADQRKILQMGKIIYKEDDDFSIRLEDKKLFFTSARYAYSARAVKNGIATPEDEGYCSTIAPALLIAESSPMRLCYRQNRCATSELATERMIEQNDSALKAAQERNDTPEQVIISAGLYALESEIKLYGEKFASAVRAFAIIDSVDKALSKLNDSANSLKQNSDKEIKEIETEIASLQKVISGAIESKYEEFKLPKSGELPQEMLKRLLLDPKSLDSRVIGATIDYLGKEIKGWFFGRGKVKFKKEDRNKVTDKVRGTLKQFTQEFLNQRQALLEEQGKKYTDAIKKAIEENGDISDAAKRVFLNIPSPKVTPPRDTADFGEIYDSHKRTSNVLWMKKEHLEKDEFIEDTEEKLLDVARTMADDYKRDYAKSLESVLAQVRHEFETNMDVYSVRMKALIEGKEAMAELGKKVAETAKELEGSQKELEKIIWKEKE